MKISISCSPSTRAESDYETTIEIPYALSNKLEILLHIILSVHKEGQLALMFSNAAL